jgi:hypothetical protein
MSRLLLNDDLWQVDNLEASSLKQIVSFLANCASGGQEGFILNTVGVNRNALSISDFKAGRKVPLWAFDLICILWDAKFEHPCEFEAWVTILAYS